MRSGQFVELGPAAQVLMQPKDPYTQSLVAAVPEILA
jgi:ABC-type dipeptide/oligopeptide/nickel transport system ATPase component